MRNKNITSNRFCYVLLILVTISFSAGAADVQPRLYSTAPDVSELVDILFPKKIRTRSLQVSKPVTASSGTVAMKIQFEFDSDQLLKETYSLLDSIAAVLNHEQSNGRGIVIEGHTDAVGDEDYNLLLSKRRARSVFNYLVTVHDIESQRLLIRGYGEYIPLDNSDPGAALNRRVQFKSTD